MTHISQHVVPRHRRSFASLSHRSFGGEWRVRTLRTSRFFALSSAPALAWQRGSVHQSTVTLVFALLVLISVGMLGFFYLSQVFGTASQGSDIQELQGQLSDLKQRQGELELEGASLRSIQTIEEDIKELNLVSADQVAYLAPRLDRVALSTP